MVEVTFEVTDIHAEMLEESRSIAGDKALDNAAEDFIHDLYKQAKNVEEEQMRQLQVGNPGSDE